MLHDQLPRYPSRQRLADVRSNKDQMVNIAEKTGMGTARKQVRSSTLQRRAAAVLLLPLLFSHLVNLVGAKYAHPSGVMDSTIGHGMIIDAGSGGSRMHVYEWKPRIFKVLPPPLSHPATSNKWTHRMEPGLSTFSTHPQDIPAALEPLITFAKDTLKHHEKHWGKYPIFLKATGGMRELSHWDREIILTAVRDYLGDPETCPFYFAFDHARVISGEEEGIYGWAAVNFLRGNLLGLSQGAGTVDVDANMTVGTLDLGGASTQISFFKTDQDVLANLFKLQIGDQKHWNVYTHSFLWFGVESARRRMFSKLAALEIVAAAEWHSSSSEGDDSVMEGHSMDRVVIDACLPAGINETFVSLLDGREYLAVPAANGSDFADCDEQTELLMEKQAHASTWCEFSHPGQCSLIGVYQPELPKGNQFGRFYAFAGYYHLWQFLDLPAKTSIASVIDEGKRVCAMTVEELASYNKGRHSAEKNVKYLPKYCFMASYATTLLMDGFGFPSEEAITFVDEIDGFKVDWALGSMLYEINALPWSYVGDGGEDPLTGCSQIEQTDGDRQNLKTRKSMNLIAAGLSVAAFVAAVAALLWTYLKMNIAKRRRRGHSSGEEASSWRSGSESEQNGRRLSSQYESISDVSPRV